MLSQLPILCGLPFLERRVSQSAHWVVGRSGKHLFLTDNDEGKPPLLLQMVKDSDDLKFMLVSINSPTSLTRLEDWIFVPVYKLMACFVTFIDQLYAPSSVV